MVAQCFDSKVVTNPLLEQGKLPKAKPGQPRCQINNKYGAATQQLQAKLEKEKFLQICLFAKVSREKTIEDRLMESWSQIKYRKEIPRRVREDGS